MGGARDSGAPSRTGIVLGGAGTEGGLGRAIRRGGQVRTLARRGDAPARGGRVRRRRRGGDAHRGRCAGRRSRRRPRMGRPARTAGRGLVLGVATVPCGGLCRRAARRAHRGPAGDGDPLPRWLARPHDDRLPGQQHRRRPQPHRRRDRGRVRPRQRAAGADRGDRRGDGRDHRRGAARARRRRGARGVLVHRPVPGVPHQGGGPVRARPELPALRALGRRAARRGGGAGGRAVRRGDRVQRPARHP
ncbi:hypothetical protein SAXI111661_20055 [Saccharomonospora xinjiangensis]